MRPEIDLRLLWYFVAVAEELSFSRAAVRVGIAQPPLSQQIQRLEHKLGGALFTREGRRVRLTEAGVALLPAARRILADAAETTRLVRRISGGQVGSLVVGFTPSALFSPLPVAVRSFRERFPAVHVELLQYIPWDHADAIRSGRLNVALVREPVREAGVVVIPFLEERLVAAIPSGHRLAASERVELAELADEPFVLFPPEITPGLYRRMQALFVGAGFEPRIIQRAHEWQTILSLVEAGLGVSLVPESLASRAGRALAFRPLHGDEVWTLTAACARAHGRSAATDAFLGVIQARAQLDRSRGPTPADLSAP